MYVEVFYCVLKFLQGSGMYSVRAVCRHATILHEQHFPTGQHDHQRPSQMAEDDDSHL